MDLLVETAQLKKAVSQIAPVAKNATVLPVLQTIKLETVDGQLTLDATDLDMRATRTIDAEVTTPGILCVNGRLLNSFLATAKVPDLHLKAEGDNLLIEGSNIHVTINGVVAEDFPVWDSADELKRFFDIDTKLFCHHISQVVDAVAADESRPVLTGLYLHDRDSHIYLVATDGYRLACQPVMKSVTEGVNLIIPAKTANYISKLFSDEEYLTLSFNESTVVFDGEHAKLVSRLIDGAYPNYAALVPTSFTTEADGDKESLEDAIRATLVFSQAQGDSTILDFSETDQAFTAESASAGDTVGSARLTTEVKVDGEGVTIRLNGNYALVALGHIEQADVKVGLNGSDKPIVFSEALGGGVYYYLVMPMAVK